MKSFDRYEHLADEDLMLRSCHDADAFGELYARYERDIFAFVRSRLQGDISRVEDVVSQVFSNAFRARHRYQKGSARGWLYQIARNAITDEFRRARPLIPLDDFHGLADRERSIVEQLSEQEAAQELRRSVAALPPPQDQILDLRLAGYTVPQIAERLDMSPQAARSAMYRAFRRLRGQLGPQYRDR